jgi:hypothetical protein
MKHQYVCGKHSLLPGDGSQGNGVDKLIKSLIDICQLELAGNASILITARATLIPPY